MGSLIGLQDCVCNLRLRLGQLTVDQLDRAIIGSMPNTEIPKGFAVSAPDPQAKSQPQRPSTCRPQLIYEIWCQIGAAMDQVALH